MKDGNVNDFIDHSTYEEVAVLYNGKKYFFRGLMRDPIIEKYVFEIEYWGDNITETVYCATAESADACMKLFLSEPIIDGKKFWDIEKEMTWVEW